MAENASNTATGADGPEGVLDLDVSDLSDDVKNEIMNSIVPERDTAEFSYESTREEREAESEAEVAIPAHILRQIELLNAEVEQDPKSIWMQGNRVFAPRSILDIEADEIVGGDEGSSEDKEFASARTRKPSSAVTLHDLPPPADLDVMFGWPSELGEAVAERSSRWSSLLDSHLPSLSGRNEEIRDELVHFGPENSLRPAVWSKVTSLNELNVDILYSQLKEDNSSFEKLISRDVPRTFPKLGMFREDAGPGQELLGSVLKAYSVYDGEVGYCQGMSFVVAGLLMVGMNECDSFAMLVRLMEGFPPFFHESSGEGSAVPEGQRSPHYSYPLRHLYTPGMPLLHALLHLLTFFMQQRMPEVQQHLEDAGVEPATWASQWFLTLFTYSFPRYVWTRAWDLMFAETDEMEIPGPLTTDSNVDVQSRTTPVIGMKPRKTYHLPRAMLVLALSAVQLAKPELLQTSDPEALLQLLRGDRICNDFDRCRRVVDQAADWFEDNNVVDVGEVRKRMREFWKSIVDRVTNQGTSSADLAIKQSHALVSVSRQTNSKPAKQGMFGFSFLRGKEPNTKANGLRESVVELREALLMWQRRAEEAENELSMLRFQPDLSVRDPESEQEQVEAWKVEKETWREEVIRLTKELEARESELMRVNGLMADMNVRAEELENLNFELSEENARLKNMLRVSTARSANYLRGPGSPVSDHHKIEEEETRVFPPETPHLGKVLPIPPSIGRRERKEEENLTSEKTSWTSRIFASVKETVFGEDDEDISDGEEFGSVRTKKGVPVAEKALPSRRGRSSLSSDDRDSTTATPNSQRRRPGATGVQGGLMVITPEMRAAGGTIFRSPSVSKKAGDENLQ